MQSQIIIGNFLIKILGNCVKGSSAQILYLMRNFKSMIVGLVGLLGLRPRLTFDRNLLWFIRLVTKSLLNNQIYEEFSTRIDIDWLCIDFNHITK